MKRLLALLLAVLLFLPSVALAGPGLDNIDEITQAYLKSLNEDIAEKTHGRVTDFYAVTNKKGQPLRSGDLLLQVPGFEEFEGSFFYVVWGPYGGEGGIKKDFHGINRARYIGYSKYGEVIGNVFYPPDFPPKGEKKPYPFGTLIPEPWGKDYVRNAFPQFFGEYQNPINDALMDGIDPDLLMRIQFGYFISALMNGYDPFDLFDPKVMGYPAYQNPERYVHIVLPPTDDTMGSGLVFHKGRDGRLYYMSVPIVSVRFMDLTGPIEIPEDMIEITPKERVAQVGEEVEFDLKVKWEKVEFMKKFYNAFGYDLGFRVTLAHKTKNGSYPIDFSLYDKRMSKLTTQSYVDLVGDLPTDFNTGTTFKVKVQSAPTEVIAEIYPFLAPHNKNQPVVFATTSDYLYKTDKAIVRPFIPDYAIQIMPKEKTAKPGEDVDFNLTVTWKEHPKDQGFRVILAYQTPNGKLPVDFTIGGMTATKGKDVSYVSNMVTQPEGNISGTVRVKAQEKPSTLIAQVIPLDKNGAPLPVQIPYDIDPKNNQDTAIVKPKGIDYVALPYKDTIKLSIPYDKDKIDQKFSLPFTRMDSIEGIVPYMITIRDSQGGYQTFSGPGLKNFEMKYVDYTMSFSKAGTYWIEYEIWPVPKDLETKPENNKARITIEVNKIPKPARPSPDSGLHVELRG